MLLDILPKFIDGKIVLKEQDDSKATYANKLISDDGKINWQNNVESIERQIRALNPNPGTYTIWNGKRLQILKAIFEICNHNFKSGMVLKAEKGFKIAGQNGFIIPLLIKLEGKKEIEPERFLHGYPKIINAIVR